jgi:hypothetical protein
MMKTLAPRLSVPDASVAARRVLDTMAATTNRARLGELNLTLAALAAPLSAEEAAKVSAAAVGILLDAFAKKAGRPVGERELLLQGLASRLSLPDASAAAHKILDLMAQTDDQHDLDLLTQGLKDLAARLSAEEAARVSWAAAQRVLHLVANANDELVMASLGESLAPLAACLREQEAAVIAQKLLDAMAKTTGELPPVKLGGAVAVFAARLNGEEAARVSGVAAGRVLGTLRNDKYHLSLYHLSRMMPALASRLSVPDASAAALKVLGAMTPNSHWEDLIYLSDILAMLTARLSAEEAAKVAAAAAGKVLDTMVRSHRYQPIIFVRGRPLQVLAPRLSVPDASAAALKVLDLVASSDDGWVLNLLTQDLAGLAARLTSEEAPRVPGIAAQRLLDLMANTDDKVNLAGLGAALVRLAARLNEQDAAGLAQKLLDAVAQSDDHVGLSLLCRTLNVLTPVLSSEEAARVQGAATQLALKVMGKDNRRYDERDWRRIMTAIGPGLATQDLLDLLKHPAWAAGRGVVLKELGRRLGPPSPQALALAAGTVGPTPPDALTAAARVALGEELHPGGRQPFVDLWEAVGWLRRHHPELDLTSPLRIPK